MLCGRNKVQYKLNDFLFLSLLIFWVTKLIPDANGTEKRKTKTQPRLIELPVERSCFPCNFANCFPQRKTSSHQFSSRSTQGEAFCYPKQKGPHLYICSMEDLSSHEEQIDSALLLYVHGRWEKWRGKVRTSEKEEDEMHVMHSVLQHQGLAGCMLSVYILIIIISFYYVHTRCKGAFTRIDYQ